MEAIPADDEVPKEEDCGEEESSSEIKSTVQSEEFDFDRALIEKVASHRSYYGCLIAICAIEPVDLEAEFQRAQCVIARRRKIMAILVVRSYAPKTPRK